MRAASIPAQRPPDAKMLVVDQRGSIHRRPRLQFASLLRPGDLVVANDAATMPASLSGKHRPTGRMIEVRLAGRTSLEETGKFSAFVFGEGDFHMRTEDRPQPPQLNPGNRLDLGPLHATVLRLMGHPRFISLRFEGPAREIREGLARHGRPIQYAHVPAALDVWDTWTPIAGPPVAFEAPSAGFTLSWSVLAGIAAQRAQFATITHAAGISSTGDAGLDALLPLDEPYRVPASTAQAIEGARARRGRIVTIGTTVVRALEHSATVFDGAVPAGERLATQKIGVSSRLRVVDAILSATHEPGSSHYEMLRAFTSDRTLEEMTRQLDAFDFRTHEFGDSIFLEAEALRRA